MYTVVAVHIEQPATVWLGWIYQVGALNLLESCKYRFERRRRGNAPISSRGFMFRLVVGYRFISFDTVCVAASGSVDQYKSRFI